MRFTRIQLTNWKNFRSVDVALPLRAFLIGPNASGKSNFLDVFRFLRDLAMPGGGLQRAVAERGGMKKIRCLLGRKPPEVTVHIEFVDSENIYWGYKIAFVRKGTFPNQDLAIIKKEEVTRNHELILVRPNDSDRTDDRLLEQTALEQISLNKEFRVIADFFTQTAYLHLVPQMIRNAPGIQFDTSLPDMYGGRFLETVASATESKRKKFLKKIEEALQIAVPQLTNLELVIDKRGIPHLQARYTHWRPDAGQQDENQFSDGTLRLIGLLWALQDGSGLLLLEEPELSLHKGIVSRLAPFIYRAQTHGKNQRQAFISTHSADLLADEGIGSQEILLFTPSDNGTQIIRASEKEDIHFLMESGLNAAEAALSATENDKLKQMSLLEL